MVSAKILDWRKYQYRLNQYLCNLSSPSPRRWFSNLNDWSSSLLWSSSPDKIRFVHMHCAQVARIYISKSYFNYFISRVATIELLKDPKSFFTVSPRPGLSGLRFYKNVPKTAPGLCISAFLWKRYIWNENEIHIFILDSKDKTNAKW